ncbi:MAG: NAD(P)/FAD-dependent oxidoreductase [Lachnospiraceae bacterium]|nr:NAD(P)/FAD-dependent oxidoreductase [Lachnospiraceae bacterium]
MKHVIVIGGGAAGMMAAIGAAGEGARVTLLEKNEKLGKKIYITGKGRCNLTNACDVSEFAEHVVSNPRFFLSALNGLTNAETIELFESFGLPTKTERGKRVFPVSDKSSDVIRVLENECRRLGVSVHLRAEVKALLTEEITPAADETAETSSDEIVASAGGEGIFGRNDKKGKSKKSKNEYTTRVTGVILPDGTKLAADAVIVATGGLSYPSTGSTGDGYRMAKACGHTVTKLYPSLVSLTAEDGCCAELSGLSLRNVGVKFLGADGKLLTEDFGELLFTHKGISGPTVLTATAVAGDALAGGTAVIDLKKGLSDEQLDARLVRELEAGHAKQMGNLIGVLVPAALGLEILRRAEIPAECKAGSVTKEQRQRLAKALRAFTLTITGLGGYNEAVVTKGGILTKEVNPSTMESRLAKGLFFAGEVLDLDATTGGFNLQIAWSTGMLAGRKAARE